MNRTAFFVFWNIFILLLCPWHGHAQSGFPGYNEFSRLYNKGDSCYTAGNYRMAGEFFFQASSVEVEKGIELSRGDMFCLTSVAFALAGEKERAYECLWKAAFEHGFSNLEALSDSSFSAIRQGTEWNKIEETVRDNHQREIARQEVFLKRTTFKNASGEVIFYPVRSGYLQQIFNRDSLTFISVNHGNFRLYFSADSYAANHLQEIKNQVEYAFYKAITVLDTNVYDKGISLVFFNLLKN